MPQESLSWLRVMQSLPIHILLANHQPLIRGGLRLLLEREPEFRVIGEAANGREALVLADYKVPDIALLEIKLPLVDGLEVAKQIVSKKSVTKPVFVTGHADEGYVNRAFKAGAQGYVAADAAPVDLARAIRVVAKGGLFLSPSISAQLLNNDESRGNISEHERQLWCLIAAGYEEGEIAKLLNVEASTVRADMRSLKSLFCRNRLPDILTESIFAKHPGAENRQTSAM